MALATAIVLPRSRAVPRAQIDDTVGRLGITPRCHIAGLQLACCRWCRIYGSSLLVPSDWRTRQKYPNKRTESLQRGEWAVSASYRHDGQDELHCPTSRLTIVVNW